MDDESARQDSAQPDTGFGRGYGSVSGDFDPFEVKEQLFGAAVVDDPHPRWAELLASCPVHPGSISGQFGATGFDTMLFTEDGQRSVYGFEEIDRLFRNIASMSSAFAGKPLRAVIGRTILEMDPPEHQRYRALIQPAFSKPEMDRWEREFVRDIVNGYIDRFVDRGHADLGADFAFHYPIHVTAVAAGMPTDDLDTFYRRAVILVNPGIAEDQRIEAARELATAIQALIDERRATPTRDLISVLAHAEFRETPDGVRHRLTDDEIIAFMRLLIPAGAQTTYRALTSILLGLLTHPDQLAAVTADRSLLPRAIEEGLRWEPPLTLAGRVATDDVEVAGEVVPSGCAVNFALGAGNRDPSRWERPDEFDIFREPWAHLTFGQGPHICLGIHAARMELRVALELLLERLPGLRLDPTAPTPRVSGLLFRTALHLPVVWDADRIDSSSPARTAER